MASRPARRATALFTPEATPAWCWLTAASTVAVRGATSSVTPTPNTMAPGSTEVT